MKGEGNWKISSKVDSALVCGKSTSVAVTEFKDKYFIVITDNGKIGSMVHVVPETSPTEKLWNSKVILGKDEPEVHAAACALAEASKVNKPVIFGFSFKEYTAAVVQDLKDLLIKTVGDSPKAEPELENILR